MINILHIITTINRGGAENQLIQNLLTQKRNGLRVEVLFLKGNGYWRRFLIEQGIDVYGPFFNKLYYFNPIGLISVLRVIKKMDYILHCHMPPSLLLISIISLFNNNKKIIYTSHNDEPFLPIKFIDEFFSNIILNKAKYIISITGSVRNYLIKKYNINSSKVKVIDYSFDPSIYKSKKQVCNELEIYRSNKIYIGIVARLVPQKRIDILIKAFKEVNNIDKNIYLVIIGSGLKKNELINLSNKLELKKYIIWIDYSEFIIDHMKKWSLFCLTSEYEGFGLVVLEAIYAKLPIIAMDVSSIKEIVGPCGEIVEFDDYLSFANKILYTLGTKKNYFDENHLKNFSPNLNFEKYLKIYKSLEN